MPSVAESLASKGKEFVRQTIAALPLDSLAELPFYWPFWRRPSQALPLTAFSIWLILAGRGFGKTRTGAETIKEWVYSGGSDLRIALVAATAADARDVMVEGESGIMSVFPTKHMPVYEPSKRRITFHTGATATIYTAEKPRQLRGPQHHKAWCDELCAWTRMEETWDMMEFGLRLGTNPQVVVTTTPKPLKLLRTIMEDEDTFTTRGSTYDNARNLSKKFLKRVEKKYEGTALGRQELYAEVLDDVQGALWNGDRIQESQVPAANVPEMARIVIGVDPGIKTKKKTEASKEPDEWGIVVCGLGTDGKGYTLADASGVMSPTEAAQTIQQLYEDWDAFCVVAETNQGGDMVETILRAHNRDMRYEGVHATKSKRLRAEPVALLYEKGECHHVNYGVRRRDFDLLEHEMCNWVPDESDWSPNRLDALVYAYTALLLDERDFGRVVDLGDTTTDEARSFNRLVKHL